MHVVFRSLLKTFVYPAKQACTQLQCNKAILLEPASINGDSITNYTHQMKIYVGPLTLLQERISRGITHGDQIKGAGLKRPQMFGTFYMRTQHAKQQPNFAR